MRIPILLTVVMFMISCQSTKLELEVREDKILVHHLSADKSAFKSGDVKMQLFIWDSSENRKTFPAISGVQEEDDHGNVAFVPTFPLSENNTYCSVKIKNTGKRI